MSKYYRRCSDDWDSRDVFLLYEIGTEPSLPIGVYESREDANLKIEELKDKGSERDYYIQPLPFYQKSVRGDYKDYILDIEYLARIRTKEKLYINVQSVDELKEIIEEIDFVEGVDSPFESIERVGLYKIHSIEELFEEK